MGSGTIPDRLADFNRSQLTLTSCHFDMIHNLLFFRIGIHRKASLRNGDRALDVFHDSLFPLV